MLVHLLILLLVYGAVAYILWWAISQIPMPPPVAIAVRVVFALIVALLVIELILPLANGGLANCRGLIC